MFFVDLGGLWWFSELGAVWVLSLEAGAEVSDPSGAKLSPAFVLEHRFSFVASANGGLHGKILSLCRGAVL